MLNRLYGWTLGLAAHRHAQYWLALIAFVEASFFPIPPHPMLGLMCLANPKRALRYGLITTIASVFGGLFGYAIGYFSFASFGTSLISALGLAQEFPQAACYVRAYGAEIILIKGATPIPFKLLTVTAGFVQMNLFTFLWSSIVSRGFQFMLVGGLFWKFGAPIKAFIEKYLGLVCLMFIAIMLAGLLMVSALRGDDGATKCVDNPTAAGTVAVTSMKDIR